MNAVYVKAQGIILVQKVRVMVVVLWWFIFELISKFNIRKMSYTNQDVHLLLITKILGKCRPSYKVESFSGVGKNKACLGLDRALLVGSLVHQQLMVSTRCQLCWCLNATTQWNLVPRLFLSVPRFQELSI